MLGYQQFWNRRCHFCYNMIDFITSQLTCSAFKDKLTLQLNSWGSNYCLMNISGVKISTIASDKSLRWWFGYHLPLIFLVHFDETSQHLLLHFELTRVRACVSMRARVYVILKTV